MIEFALGTKKKPFGVLIDYGQKHIEELKYAESHLSEGNIPYKILKVNLGENISSGLTGNLVSGKYGNAHPMHVPGRNTIFLGLALSVAESMNIKTVWIGPDFSDYLNSFPDCSQEFIGRMNNASQISPSYPINIEAPLLGMTKELIKSLLSNQYQIKENTYYSGYEPPKKG